MRIRLPLDWRMALFGIVLPAAAYFGVAAVADYPASTAHDHGLRNVSEPGRYDETVVLFISSAFCGGNSVEGFRRAVTHVYDQLGSQFAAAGRDLRRVGVALDRDPSVGYEYLQGFGQFDEITVGGNWLNHATEKYFWQTGLARASIPQILVFHRVIDQQEKTIAVVEETLLISKVGAEEIVDWAEAGMPGALDTSVSSVGS